LLASLLVFRKKGMPSQQTAKNIEAENNDLLLFNRKIDNAVAGLNNCYHSLLTQQVSSRDNAANIADYIAAMRTETNISDNYRASIIKALSVLSKFHYNKKLFRQMTRDDIIGYLDSLRKAEASDPLHKWIGTYNLARIHFLRFFKWLYYPDIQHDKRPKPSIIENIPQLKRKETSIYKPTDLWTSEAQQSTTTRKRTVSRGVKGLDHAYSRSIMVLHH
jgi:hypothetical protein